MLEMLTLNQSLYVSLAGFLASFVMLFYFVSKFNEKETLVPETSAETVMPRPPAPPVLRSKQIEGAEHSLEEINREITDFKTKIQQMRGLIDKRRHLHEKQIEDIVKNINLLVGGLENIRPEHVEQIQPGLQSLMKELEVLRTPLAGDAVNPGPRS